MVCSGYCTSNCGSEDQIRGLMLDSISSHSPPPPRCTGVWMNSPCDELASYTGGVVQSTTPRHFMLPKKPELSPVSEWLPDLWDQFSAEEEVHCSEIIKIKQCECIAIFVRCVPCRGNQSTETTSGISQDPSQVKNRRSWTIQGGYNNYKQWLKLINTCMLVMKGSYIKQTNILKY